MKKSLSILMALLLLVCELPIAWAGSGLSSVFERSQPTAASGLSGQFEGWDEPQPTERPAPPEPTTAPATPDPTAAPTTKPPPDPTSAPALFDEGVRDITCASFGNRVDYAPIGDWIISRGYLQELDRYCLIGEGPSGVRTALTQELPSSFTPADDALVYYGKDANDKWNWVIRASGTEQPKRLSLSLNDEVFYADAEFIWYYTHIGEEISIRRLMRKGGAKKGLGRTTGSVVGMMESGDVLIADFTKNRVLSWQNGKATTLYNPEKPILSVSSAGRSIWVQHEREFGLLEDGRLGFCLPGHIMSMTGTTDQFVLLLSFPGSTEYDVILFNDLYRAYARVGTVPAAEQAFVELQPGQKITVWSPIQSLIFDIPPAAEWIPYGYYDVESARAQRGNW